MAQRYLLQRSQPAVCNNGDGAIDTCRQTARSTVLLGTADNHGNLDILVHKKIEEAEDTRKGRLEELTADLIMGEEGSAEWQELKIKITCYSQLVKAIQLAPRKDNMRCRGQVASHMNTRVQPVYFCRV